MWSKVLDPKENTLSCIHFIFLAEYLCYDILHFCNNVACINVNYVSILLHVEAAIRCCCNFFPHTTWRDDFSLNKAYITLSIFCIKKFDTKTFVWHFLTFACMFAENPCRNVKWNEPSIFSSMRHLQNGFLSL